MDPVTASSIITALASGAKFVASTVAKEEVKAKYLSLKEFIGEKFGLVKPVEQLEKRPTQQRQNLLAEDLADSIEAMEGTQKEVETIIAELLNKTQTLTESLEKLPKEEFEAVGLDLDNIKAVNVKIENVISEGGARVVGIKAKNSEFTGDITAGNIQAKAGDTQEKK